MNPIARFQEVDSIFFREISEAIHHCETRVIFDREALRHSQTSGATQNFENQSLADPLRIRAMKPLQQALPGRASGV